MDPRSDAPWLAALVAPVSVAEFLSTYWLKQHVFCRGASDKFSSLISWTVINDILEHHWRETYRFRLARQGRDLDPVSYADLGGFTPRVRAKDVTEELRRGATLSFDAIDEVHEPLTRLAREGQLAAYRHDGFWQCMDTVRDVRLLNTLWADGRAPWAAWKKSVKA